MNIIGTIYLVDEPHIDVLRANLMTTPPPGGSIATGTMLCIDLDETTDMLEMNFPDHCQKATLLCPPPLAMHKEIDGDMEGFIEAYNDYLDYDESVQEFIASILLYLHIGGNILMYIPSHIEDETVWVNTLVLYFYTRYGITIGSGPDKPASYDPKYDGEVADMMYSRGYMEVLDYINSTPNMVVVYPMLRDKLCRDLLPYCAPGENPLDMYYYIKRCILQNGVPVYKPALVFDR